MPKVSVYLPDDLYDEVRQRELPLSALAQQAIRDAIASAGRSGWVERMRDRAVDAGPDVTSTENLMEAVGDEFEA